MMKIVSYFLSSLLYLLEHNYDSLFSFDFNFIQYTLFRLLCVLKTTLTYVTMYVCLSPHFCFILEHIYYMNERVESRMMNTDNVVWPDLHKLKLNC